MGIHGIYKEIGPGKRIALAKVAVEHFASSGRPLRIAIDTSIWLFQIQSSKGGTNPALRTFYYRLLRLISLSIHPLFVFDGPNKPPFKRNKRTGPNVASIPEFLAKQLLKQFGLPFHLAPGEAEAECALLQREGVVDAVLSEDVDTLMFGSGLTFRSWTPEASKSKVPTHINLYDANITKSSSGLDREGMILVALMSGGDYVPEGIPGCGPKTACEAARARFGLDLCRISRRDKAALEAWKGRLTHELHTNESKFFNRKHGKLAIPEDFPNPEVLGYYTHPVVSPLDKIEKLRGSLRWDLDIDFKELRTFSGDAFDWTKLGGAKKFIRNLAPALLVRELRMKAEHLVKNSSDQNASDQAADLIKGIHGTRTHASTDGITELRVSFMPHELVPIDLDAEEPDDELNNDSSDEEGNVVATQEEAGSPSKKRAPSTYNPNEVEKLWISEIYVKTSVPAKFRVWENKTQTALALAEARNANRSNQRTTQSKRKPTGEGTSRGALDRFTKASKPGISRAQPKLPDSLAPTRPNPRASKAPSHGPRSDMGVENDQGATTTSALSLVDGQEVIDLLSPPTLGRSIANFAHDSYLSSVAPGMTMQNVNTKRRRSPLRHLHRAASNMAEQGSTVSESQRIGIRSSSPTSLPSPTQLFPSSKRQKSPPLAEVLPVQPVTPSHRHQHVQLSFEPILVTSSPSRQTHLHDYFTPKRRAAAIKQTQVMDVVQPTVGETLDLTGSPTPKAKRLIQPLQHVAATDISVLAQVSSQRGCGISVARRKSKESVPVALIGSVLTALPSISHPVDCEVDARSPKEKGGRNILYAPASHKASAPPRSIARTKTVYRVRDSLPGSFAIDEVDLTAYEGIKTMKVPANNKGKRIFRVSEVGVLDLTGD